MKQFQLFDESTITLTTPAPSKPKVKRKAKPRGVKPQAELFPGAASGASASATCKVCGRPIWAPLSLAYGMGPVCRRGHTLNELPKMNNHPTDKSNPFDGILFSRHEDGTFITNLEHTYDTGASPTGFETGYGGSGPSEFALNLTEFIIGNYFHLEGDMFFSIRSGSVSATSWTIRHSVKEWLIVPVDLAPGDSYVLPIAIAAHVCLNFMQPLEYLEGVTLTRPIDETTLRADIERFRERFGAGTLPGLEETL